MICSSWPVPSVTVTSACVSPRVNSAEPCERGRTPTSETIGRTVLVSRPSTRTPVDSVASRNVDFSRSLSTPASAPASTLFVAGMAVENELLGLGDLFLARELVRLAERRGQRVAADVSRVRREFAAVLDFRQRPRPCGAVPGKFGDCLDHGLIGVMRKHDGAQHLLLGKLPGFRLDHHHGVRMTRDHQIEAAVAHLLDGGVENVFAVDKAHPGAADRSPEGNSRQRERRRSADKRDDVGIVLEVVRQHGADDLRLVAEARREQRPDRAVDNARGERLLFRRATLALEETAWNLACGERLFLIVHGERKEIDALPRLPLGDGGAQHDSVAVTRKHGPVGLTCDPSGLERQLATAPDEFLPVNGKHPCLFLFFHVADASMRRRSPM